MSDLVIAAVQMTSGEDVEANLERARELVCEAATAGALLVGLPENFAYLGSDKDHKVALAEETGDGARGPILEAMRQVAREAGVWLLLGGFPERAGPVRVEADGLRPTASVAGGAEPSQGSGLDRIGNTSLLLDPEGAIRARYRKIHLFDVEVPGGQRFRESETVEAGTEPRPRPTP